MDLECKNCKTRWALPEEGREKLREAASVISQIAKEIGIRPHPFLSPDNPLPFLNAVANCCKKPLIQWVIPEPGCDREPSSKERDIFESVKST